jgi:hypothetical protein
MEQEKGVGQRVTKLLQQQAALAAKATAQTMATPSEGVMEQVKFRGQTCLVLNISEFEGEAATLTDFIS